jgi:hypothetical protein
MEDAMRLSVLDALTKATLVRVTQLQKQVNDLRERDELVTSLKNALFERVETTPDGGKIHLGLTHKFEDLKKQVNDLAATVGRQRKDAARALDHAAASAPTIELRLSHQDYEALRAVWPTSAVDTGSLMLLQPKFNLLFVRM